MNRIVFLALFLVAALGFNSLIAQQAPPSNWFHLDKSQDGYLGVSTQKLYKNYINGKQGVKVIVAVIDSGVETDHEDLKDVLWTNTDEIPNNGKDDDKNGYIDDIHGWNFLGNAKGENVAFEQMEETRQYLVLKKQFESLDTNNLNKQQQLDFEQLKDYENKINAEITEMTEQSFFYQAIATAAKQLQSKIGKDKITTEDLTNFKSDQPLFKEVANMMKEIMISESMSYETLIEELESSVKSMKGMLDYGYNLSFEARSIVGDDPSNFSQIDYGNNDYEGPDAEHGTHVAGIIAATRGNGKGMDGVANNVEIMVLRAVPDGDERDKDIATAIRYAVDNGAQIINMSFGKSFSPYKEELDKAVKYALKKDVLLVHAAGNDNEEVFPTLNFPNDRFVKKGLFGPKYSDNWITVGALSWKDGEEMVASFSNYSKDHVDVFAPGVKIYSSVIDGGYSDNDGTSMAAPVVSGVAALLRSYFPDLSAKQVRNILIESAVRQNNTVIQPGTEKLVPFSQLSVSGGVVNAVKAFELAQKMKGKLKKNKALREEIWD